MRTLPTSEMNAALANKHVRAFLDCIAAAEGTKGRGNNGYNIMIGGRVFHDYSRHPHSPFRWRAGHPTSDAAGRYQFLSSTWRTLAKQYGFKDFSPGAQDRAAIALIHEKGALPDIMRGDCRTALYKCRKVWASLPGANYSGQGMRPLSFVLSVFEKSLREIEKGIEQAGRDIKKGVQQAGRDLERALNPDPIDTRPLGAPGYRRTEEQPRATQLAPRHETGGRQISTPSRTGSAIRINQPQNQASPPITDRKIAYVTPAGQQLSTPRQAPRTTA
jgi:muramidase (phage lysozyme)